MNMNKALQNLYHAVSGSTTTKVNISKLLVDIHYAITGVESSVKNNWSRIIDSMATNWPEGGGGSSDFSTANVTIIDTVGNIFNVVDMRVPYIRVAPMITPPVECIWDSLWDKTGTVNLEVVLYKGNAVFRSGATSDVTTTVTSGNAEVVTFSDEWGTYADVIIKGDCTITLSSPT